LGSRVAPSYYFNASPIALIDGFDSIDLFSRRLSAGSRAQHSFPETVNPNMRSRGPWALLPNTATARFHNGLGGGGPRPSYPGYSVNLTPYSNRSVRGGRFLKPAGGDRVQRDPGDWSADGFPGPRVLISGDITRRPQHRGEIPPGLEPKQYSMCFQSGRAVFPRADTLTP